VRNPDLPLQFRPMASPPERKFLQAFHQEAGWAPLPRKELEKVLAPNPRMQWVCVEVDKAIIGIARLELVPPEFCYLSSLVIKRKYRRQGIGRWLLHHVEALCLKRGVKRLLLLPEVGSNEFYDALGFVPDPLVQGILKKELSPFGLKKLL